MRGRRSLMGVVAACVLLGIGGLYAWLRDRPRYSCEILTVAAMRDYVEAQYDYRRANRNQRGEPVFADRLTKLQGLLPAAFIAAYGADGKPYHGFLFREIRSIGGAQIDWRRDFALYAVPDCYGHDGYRTFIVATNGMILGPDLGPRAVVSDYPEDIQAAGWYVEDGQPTVDPGTGKYNRDPWTERAE